MKPDLKNPAMVRLIQAIAEQVVREHLTPKPAPAQEKPEARPNHGRVAQAAKAA
jgi:hypothetical protein